MADMKKVYDDLTIINLYILINFLFSDWTQFLQPIWDSINLSNNVSRLNKNRNKNAKVANLSRPQTLNLHRASREEQGHYLAVGSYMVMKDQCSFYMGTIRTKWPLCRYESKLFFYLFAPLSSDGKSCYVSLNLLWCSCPKGQLISKCLFGIFNSPKKTNEKNWLYYYATCFRSFFGRN